MKERGILFTGAMVRPILDGTKTQTRRLVKDSAWRDYGDCDSDGKEVSSMGIDRARCPYGKPGDRLWVRETWRYDGSSCSSTDGFKSHTHFVTFIADKVRREFVTDTMDPPGVPKQPEQMPGEIYSLREAPEDFAYNGENTYCDRLSRWWKKIRPSIFMPRWASRITLEVIDVRVERLQDITEADALAEGITCERILVDAHCGGGRHTEVHATRYFFDGGPDEGFDNGVDAYLALFDQINGAGASDANPWVWAITFRDITPEK